MSKRRVECGCGGSPVTVMAALLQAKLSGAVVLPYSLYARNALVGHVHEIGIDSEHVGDRELQY